MERGVLRALGFDVSQPSGDQAFRGAEFGWAKMLKQLAVVVAGLAGCSTTFIPSMATA